MSKNGGDSLTRLDTKSMSPPAEELYDFLSARVKGQERALKEIVSAFELQISNFDTGDRPKFTGLFLGPSGVGKTLVAEVLAESFFGDRKAFMKVECASYSQPHQVALLIGSPPGYIGFNQDANSPFPLLSQHNIDKYGYLANQRRPENLAKEELIKKMSAKLKILGQALKEMKEAKKDNNDDFKKKFIEFKKLKLEKEKIEAEAKVGETKYDSVILFDEIEKAHPDFWNILLEITDKGRFTLSNGNVTDFRRSYIILTSNVGSGRIADTLNDMQLGFRSQNSKSKNSQDQEIYEVAREEASEKFPTEFMGRLDTIVVFRPLGRDSMREIFEVQKAGLISELNNGDFFIKLNIDDDATNFIIDQATKHSGYGARMLKHRMDEYIKKPIARLKNWGKEKGITNGDILEVKYETVDGRKRLVFYRRERSADMNKGNGGDPKGPGGPGGGLVLRDDENEKEMSNGNGE